ncbi:carbonic anhydrase family protein [Helicobacter sp. NHP22-001]|uniref:carbonic anhydrase n=1 Tax=Helicobacter sp. NHP22-001 TaxID=3040202 RepID=UPI00244D83D9|nr:carbonic anhydrase family protein [Helicobacter sp. NHP22-001]GMB95792.1 carbonic anhydrase [Helicobacter sp. NHP22-001]
MKTSLFLIGLSLSLPMALGAEHWSYEAHTGAKHWDKLHKDYAVCKAGKNQSPINIEHYYHAPDKENFVFNYHSTAPTSIDYAHHTFVAKFAHPKDSTIYRDHKYNLVNLHFHIPMEFAIHGKRQPLSMHLVHKDAQGRLLVVGIGFTIGQENPFLTPLLNAYTYKTPPKPLALEKLLPDTIHYYHFNGSLTTPPCTEGVTWFVLEETLSLSPQQFEGIKKIMHNKPNQRPLQKDYNRVIVKSSAIVREH